MKPVTKVFMVIGALALCMLVWGLVFSGEDGLVGTVWNGVASPINEKWQSMTGDSTAELIPEFDTAGGTEIDNMGDADPNGGGAVGP